MTIINAKPTLTVSMESETTPATMSNMEGGKEEGGKGTPYPQSAPHYPHPSMPGSGYSQGHHAPYPTPPQYYPLHPSHAHPPPGWVYYFPPPYQPPYYGSAPYRCPYPPSSSSAKGEPVPGRGDAVGPREPKRPRLSSSSRDHPPPKDPHPRPPPALPIPAGKSVRRTKKLYSDFVGVTYNKTHAKYQACITHRRRQHFLGRYRLAVDAALAYDESARLLKGRGWKVNFPTRAAYEEAKRRELWVIGEVVGKAGAARVDAAGGPAAVEMKVEDIASIIREGVAPSKVAPSTPSETRERIHDGDGGTALGDGGAGAANDGEGWTAVNASRGRLAESVAAADRGEGPPRAPRAAADGPGGDDRRGPETTWAAAPDASNDDAGADRTARSNATLRAAEVAEIDRVVAGSDGKLSKDHFRHATLDLRPGRKLGIVLQDLEAHGIPRIRELLPGMPARDAIPPAYREECGIASLKCDGVGRARPRTKEECFAFFVRAQEGSADGSSSKVEALLIKTKALRHLRRSPLLPRNPWPRPQQQSQQQQQQRQEQLEEDNEIPENATPCTDARDEWLKQQDAMRERQNQYDAFVDFKKQHGHCDVECSQHPKLADRIEVRRGRRDKGTLTKAQTMKLNIIHTPATSKDTDSDNSNQGQSRSVESSQHPKLADRIEVQRERRDKGTPSNAQTTKLNIIHMPATSKDDDKGNSNEGQSWNGRFEAIVRFKKRCGIFPAAGELRGWLDEQAEAIGSMPLERVRKLVEAGVRLSEENVRKLRERWGDEVDEWHAELADGGTDDNVQLVFWQSAEAANLFGFARGDDVRKGIRDRVDLLKKANESDEGWKALVPNDGKEDLYSPREIKAVRHKALFLAKSYLLALERMNKTTWGECCKEAAAQLEGLGFRSFGAKSIMIYQHTFSTGNAFPHPSRIVKEKERTDCYRILEYFPKAKEMFQTIARESIEQDLMSSCHMQDKLANVILPAIKSESQKEGCYDDKSPAQSMLVKMLERPPGPKTMCKWMKELGIEYDPLCSSKGRGGKGSISRSMKACWALGMFADRRPRGQGLKRGKATKDEEKQQDEEENVVGKMSDIQAVEVDQDSVST